MKSKIMLLGLFLAPFIVFSNEIKSIKIEDENKIFNISKIEFENYTDLENKVKKINETLLEQGYITSSAKIENEKIVINAGKIDKVILEDGSTSEPEFKKNFLGLNLEQEVLNIKKIDDIVRKFNKEKSNKFKVYLFPSENKVNYTDLKLVNEYKPYFDKKIIINSNSDLKKLNFDYSLNFSKSQPLGLNDKLDFAFSILHSKQKAEINYKLPYKNMDFEIGTSFSRNKIDKNIKENSYTADLSIGKDLNENWTLKNKIQFEYSKQDLLDVNTKKHIYLTDSLSLDYFNVINSKYIIFNTSKIQAALVNDMLNNERKPVMTFENDLNLLSKYYDANLKMAYSSTELYDKYMFSNSINSYHNPPVYIPKTNKIIYLNNKLKYPIEINKLKVTPFAEIAVAYNDELKYGLGLGTQFDYNKFSAGLKYIITNNKKSSINVNLEFKF